MKKRLDQLVVERGLAGGRDQAKRLILAGKVFVEDELADKPGRAFDSRARLELRGASRRFVGRGGFKLLAALKRFSIAIPPGCRALDIGASTGGFTDCLLQRGAGRVIAVDSGRAQLHQRLRADPRVDVHERTNARYLTLEKIGGEPVDFIVIDVSFISLQLILPPCPELLVADGEVVALIKPQFEARRDQVGSKGVVRDRDVHRQVLERIVAFCAAQGWFVADLAPSALLGAEGNVEFFIRLRRPSAPTSSKIDVEAVVDEAYNLQASNER